MDESTETRPADAAAASDAHEDRLIRRLGTLAGMAPDLDATRGLMELAATERDVDLGTARMSPRSARTAD